MPDRVRVSAGTAFESVFGYSRALRAGPWVMVSGCTAANPDGPVGGADIVAQSAECLRRVRCALEEAGASLGDVVRTRFYVTDITALAAIGRVHRDYFGDVLPASTIVEVSALALPSLLVEVEADAIVAD